MNYLDLTLPTPAENLACDEALLDGAEEHGGPGVVRFWESARHFVVLGYANKVNEQADVAASRQLGVPILRRCSGGGAVLQGPGCLNYCLILKMEEAAPQPSITATNSFVMQRNAQALAKLLGKPVTIEGFTDLAVGQLKFSGNAQRRKRNWLLFHGTFLLDIDFGLMEQLLPLPARQPAYRERRSHAAFLTRLAVPSGAIKDALRETWSALQPHMELPCADISRLVLQKYAADEWNFKW